MLTLSMFVPGVVKGKVITTPSPYVMTVPHPLSMGMSVGRASKTKNEPKIRNSTILEYLLSTPFVINTHITKGVFYAIR